MILGFGACTGFGKRVGWVTGLGLVLRMGGDSRRLGFGLGGSFRMSRFGSGFGGSGTGFGSGGGGVGSGSGGGGVGSGATGSGEGTGDGGDTSSKR